MNTKFTKVFVLNCIKFTILISILTPTISIAAILEEVVVTAQKREQNIQDVGIAITAFSGEQIDALGFENSIDVARMSPGVSISGDTGGQKSIFTVRGVVQNDPGDISEAPVAVYVDEGYVATLNGQIFSLWDVERVEVAKGPQGTLFGRNATGGLVHFISRKPTDEFEAYTKLTYGSYEQVRVEGAFSGPITDNVKGRVSGVYNRHDGVYENIFPNQALNCCGPVPGGGQDLGNDDTWGVRGHLLFNPNDNLEILLSGYGSRSVIGVGATEQQQNISVVDAQGRVIGGQEVSATETREGIGPGGVNADVDGLFPFPLTRPVPGGDYFGYTQPEGAGVDNQDFIISQDFAFDDINTYESYGGTAKIIWELDGFTVTSITDYKKYQKNAFVEPESSATDWFVVGFDVDSDTVAQEIRLNGETEHSRWVAGLYYLYIDNQSQGAFLTLGTSILAPLGFESDIVEEPDTQTNSYSVFGQVDYDLTESLTLIGGLRVIREEKDLLWRQGIYLNENPLTIDTNVLFFGAPDIDISSDATLWAGKIQLDWYANDDMLIYAGVNRGVKSGGFNVPVTFGLIFDVTQIPPFKEEVLWAYEAGFKSTLFNGTTRFNGSLYYYDYNDYQVVRWANIAAFTVNVDATIYGAEFELISNPTPGLDLMLTLGLVEAEAKDVEIAPAVFRDTTPPYSPEVTLAGIARYEWPDNMFGGKVYAQMDFNYVSDFYSNLRNFDSHKEESYILGNARLGWNSDDGKWEAAFFVNNIADNRYVVINFDNTEFCGCSENILGKPRWFGGSVRYNWQ